MKDKFSKAFIIHDCNAGEIEQVMKEYQAQLDKSSTPYNQSYLSSESWKLNLVRGNYFMKHNKWFNSKLRFVFVDKNLENLYWGKSVVKGSRVQSSFD